jgi:hypothetical protein
MDFRATVGWAEDVFSGDDYRRWRCMSLRKRGAAGPRRADRGRAANALAETMRA